MTPAGAVAALLLAVLVVDVVLVVADRWRAARHERRNQPRRVRVFLAEHRAPRDPRGGAR